VALKVYTREEVNQEEFKIYQHLSRANPSHLGYPHVRTALDTFTIRRSGGDHTVSSKSPCGKALGIFYIVIRLIDLQKIYLGRALCRFSLRWITYTQSASLFTQVRKIPVLRTVALLTRHLVDIKGDNILQEIEDKSILEAFTKAEMEHSSPENLSKMRQCMLHDGSNGQRHLAEPY